MRWVMNIHFTGEELSDFKTNAKREWSITNGIGGYAGGSVIGSLGRTHQGYLIASFHPPVERYLVFSKTNEILTCGEKTYSLESSQHAGKELDHHVVSSGEVPDVYKAPDTVSVASDFTPREAVYTEGQTYLSAFDYDGNVCFTYHAGAVTLEKYITLVRDENTAAIAYRIRNEGESATLSITPLMNFREHNESSSTDTLSFHKFALREQCGFVLIPQKDPSVSISLCASEGTLMENDCMYDIDLQFATEVENEVPGLDTCYTPYRIEIEIPAHTQKEISLLCHAGTEDSDWNTNVKADTAFAILRENENYYHSLIETADCPDTFSEILTIAADRFLSYRKSTQLTTVLAGLPWFTDWGRDTMIAFTGLVLSTNRFQKAEEILLTFAKYVDHGMVPNMFPDNGQDPLYNTVDASLWYFYAVHKYLEYHHTPEAYAFIRDNIYPALKEIIAAYREGTLFSIHMEDDGLIHAGSGIDQVTWMDVRVGDWVVTPRHGKPVEINALWYNALCVIADLSAEYGDDSADYRALAQQVKTSFCEKFWNPATGCLDDVVGDDSIRPNQIYAVSLPFRMLDAQKERSIVEVVKEKLFVGVGLRSLDPAHPDYHPIYIGSLPKRDAAYHQGTAWGFLTGAFITAYCNVYGRNADTARECLHMLKPLREHLYVNCVGSICEIFDGDAPHHGRGCYAQAWSVGETLRCYKEDILPYL